ncbi:MAG: hypothetical protein LBP95_02620 [Deltaproteobacteria bacterium]|nr:hypothetical protein [Deltaproteobacteria bacterium]
MGRPPRVGAVPFLNAGDRLLVEASLERVGLARLVAGLQQPAARLGAGPGHRRRGRGRGRLHPRPHHILWFCDTVTALKDGAVLADRPAGVAVGKKLLAGLHNRRVEIVAAGDRTMVCPVAADGDGSGADI